MSETIVRQQYNQIAAQYDRYAAQTPAFLPRLGKKSRRLTEDEKT